MHHQPHFRTFNPLTIRDNIFELIGTDWMLVTAGDPDAFNTMTASWGGMGILWNLKVAWCVIRPTRHTFGFMERHDRFTLSFFTEQHRAALELCGALSGRDTDKVSRTGLHPLAVAPGCVTFIEARLVLCCRKIYHHDITPAGFHDPAIHNHYAAEDYHRMYVGEITAALMP